MSGDTPEMDREDMEADNPIVDLVDEEGRSLRCYVERSLEVEGTEYVLLLPVDAPIQVFAWEEDEDDEEEDLLVDIDDEEVDEVFSTARAVLAEQDLVLNRTAITLTVTGVLPEAEEDDIITLDIEDVEGGVEGNGDHASQEQFQQLASFFYEKQEYVVCTPLDPLLFFARMNAKGQPELLSPEEFQLVQPHLEDQLFEDLE